MISHSRKRLGEPGRFFYPLCLRRLIKAGIFPVLLISFSIPPFLTPSPYMASPHPAMLWGTAGEECDTRFVVVAVFQPLRPSDTSPIFCCAKHRGGGDT